MVAFSFGVHGMAKPLLSVHLIDGTYELFRQFYGRRRFEKKGAAPFGAVAGVMHSLLEMIEKGATHVGVATDHVIESFRNRLWPGYKTGEGIEPALRAQFTPLEQALGAMGVAVWPMIELEADDALASAARAAAADKKVQQVCIWTPDKDLAQCVRGNRVVQVLRRAKLILDAAHMAGTRVSGRQVGPEPDVVVYSFQAVKNLPTADAGMICFKDAEDDERARKLTWLGINKDTYSRTASQGAYKWMYDVEEVGFKYHGNSIMAAIGLVQIKWLDQDNSYRRQIAAWYRARLAGHSTVRLVEVAPGCESATHLFQVLVNSRDAVMLALNEHQIYPGVHYRDNTEYSMYSYAAGTCPNAARASSRVISLPIHMNLSGDDVNMVSDILLRYAK